MHGPPSVFRSCFMWMVPRMRSFRLQTRSCYNSILYQLKTCVSRLSSHTSISILKGPYRHLNKLWYNVKYIEINTSTAWKKLILEQSVYFNVLGLMSRFVRLILKLPEYRRRYLMHKTLFCKHRTCILHAFSWTIPLHTFYTNWYWLLYIFPIIFCALFRCICCAPPSAVPWRVPAAGSTYRRPKAAGAVSPPHT